VNHHRPRPPIPATQGSGRRSLWLGYAIIFIMLMAWVALYGEDEGRWVRALLFHLAKALF
jgi:hypothetical protein